jgi:hypothetical protein
MLLCNLKETPDVKGEKEYGRCCFFQGPTPATSENQRVVRIVSERPARESYEFNQGTLKFCNCTSTVTR